MNYLLPLLLALSLAAPIGCAGSAVLTPEDVAAQEAVYAELQAENDRLAEQSAEQSETIADLQRRNELYREILADQAAALRSADDALAEARRAVMRLLSRLGVQP